MSREFLSFIYLYLRLSRKSTCERNNNNGKKRIENQKIQNASYGLIDLCVGGNSLLLCSSGSFPIIPMSSLPHMQFYRGNYLAPKVKAVRATRGSPTTVDSALYIF